MRPAAGKVAHRIAWSLVCGLVAFPVAPAGEFSPLTVNVIQRFVPGSEQTHFGSLEFLGGLRYSSSDSRVGGVSAIRFRPNGRDFLAVLDTGKWMTGAIERDGEGRLSGLAQVSVTPMLGADGHPASRKSDMDCEGLALREGQVLVSCERRHRIDVYPHPGFQAARPMSVEMIIPRRELRANGGIETVAVSPLEGPLRGAAIAIAEKSIDEAGNLFAAVLDGPRKGIFKVARDIPWDVTDGAFLPDGDLLLLERRFSYTGGLGMRIRRIAGDAIRAGALVDGDVLLDAGMGAEIDNMEGIDVVAGPDGEIRIIVVSDDNKSFLQRNLMLEFGLAN